MKNKGTVKLSKKRRKILIVDDHPLMREGFAKLVNQQSDLTVCCEASSAEEALEFVSGDEPDLMVTDITLPGKDGIELIKDLKSMHPDFLILVLSMHDESIYAERCLRAGARGYLMKQESSTNVLSAMRKILDGGVYVSDQLSAKILEIFSGSKPTSRRSPIEALTDREFEIYQAIGKGQNVKEIASRLHISQKTVEAHRANIREKLQLASANELTIHAVRWIESHHG